MMRRLACVVLLSFGFACSSPAAPAASGGSTGSSGSGAVAGSSAAGSASAGAAATAGMSAGGAPGAGAGGMLSHGGVGAGGAAAGGAATGGAATNGGATSGGAPSGGATGSAGSGSGGFSCPAGPFAAPAVSGKHASKVAGTPPKDAFNNQLNDFTNVEGPVWLGDSLYFSEMTGADLPPARILKIGPGNVVSVAVADSGSNGLALDTMGNLLAAVHKDGSVSKVALPGGMETPLVSEFGQPPTRFNSPNDLTVRSDGTIYFSDPNYQNSKNPQKAERLYRITPPPTRTVSVATSSSDTGFLRPNGVTLSPDEKTLYVSGSNLKKFAVMADGTLGVGSDFVAGASGDGMAVDCGGNLYVAGGSSGVRVYSPTGTLIGTITTDGGTTTNVAFGGTDHMQLYVTAQGSSGSQGVFTVTMNVPGYPY